MKFNPNDMEWEVGDDTVAPIALVAKCIVYAEVEKHLQEAFEGATLLAQPCPENLGDVQLSLAAGGASSECCDGPWYNFSLYELIAGPDDDWNRDSEDRELWALRLERLAARLRQKPAADMERTRARNDGGSDS